MSNGEKRRGLWIDPRTKILLLLLCVLSATMAPSLLYEMLVVALVACFGIVCGKVRYSIIGVIVYGGFYLLTQAVLQMPSGNVQVMLIAFLGLVHKVYPCGILSGIIISTTKVGEFLSAMNRSHISQKIVIPVAVMLRYVPTIREDWHFIKDAMRLRDVSPSLKGLISHPGMTIECLYSPLLMAASKAADELAIASVTRGIENPHARTCLIQIRFRIRDFLIICCFAVMMVVNFIGRGGAI